jgi:hypothetical protein
MNKTGLKLVSEILQAYIQVIWFSQIHRCHGSVCFYPVSAHRKIQLLKKDFWIVLGFKDSVFQSLKPGLPTHPKNPALQLTVELNLKLFQHYFETG